MHGNITLTCLRISSNTPFKSHLTRNRDLVEDDPLIGIGYVLDPFVRVYSLSTPPPHPTPPFLEKKLVTVIGKILRLQTLRNFPTLEQLTTTHNLMRLTVHV